VATKHNAPGWREIKTQLAGFDREGLLVLLKDLHDASLSNRRFLQARFVLGEDSLQPYKIELERWLFPALERGQDFSIGKAKKVLSDYRKACGDSEGMAELCVYYCEQVRAFLGSCGVDDEAYYLALESVFSQALGYIRVLPEASQSVYLVRLQPLLEASYDYGWGVYECLLEAWLNAGFDFETAC
jgi:hypothetical protein